MRHLFGTWKGVFPLPPLQTIEKELGFQSSTNGLSGAAPSRTDSQSPRPSNSIHVNPKYLEARQQLNQPTKGILGSGAKTAVIADTDDDIERANRLGTERSAGRRLDAPNARPNIEHIQRDPFSNPIHEKLAGRDVRGLGFSNTSQQAVVGTGQVRSKPRGQDGIGGPYYASGVVSSEEKIDKRSNFYTSKDVRPSGSVHFDSALLPTRSINANRVGRPSSNKSWKHSEEEEYVWDDVPSKTTEYSGTHNIIKGEWMSDDGNAKFASLQSAKWADAGPVECIDPKTHKVDNVSRFGFAAGQERRISAYMDQEEYLLGKREVEARIDREIRPYGQQFPAARDSSLWVSQEKALPDNGLDPWVSKFSNQPAEMSICTGTMPASIISSVPVRLSGHYAGRSNLDTTNSVPIRSTEAFGQQKHRYWSSSPPQAHPPSSTAPFARQGSPNHDESDFYPSGSFSQLGQDPQEEYSQRALPVLAKGSHVVVHNDELTQGQPSLQATLQTQKYPIIQSKSHINPSDQLQASFLCENSPSLFRPSIQLGEVSLPSDSTPISSDLTSASNLLAGLIKSGFKPSNHSDAQPLGPSGSLLVASLSLQNAAGENTILQTQTPNTSRPPLPPGLPPPPSTQSAEKAAPLSSLLSSLVAKGLISSPASDSSDAVISQPNKESSINGKDVAASGVPLPALKSSFGKVSSSNSDSSAPPNASLPKAIEIEMGDLIGLEFKPEKLRKYHEHVISYLDDQSHQCKMCGNRFGLEELSLHTSSCGPRESRTIYTGIAPKRWYPSRNIYIDGSHEIEDSAEASDAGLGSAEVCEFMVHADERQIICALCGEPFDDVYSFEKGNWMYKDAVFLDYAKGKNSCGNNVKGEEHVPIVHVRCMPRGSNDGMDVD
ncbi:ENTH/VHS family protein [Zea mays]|nr:ENTH/VHS family protein [Zea mays]ONM53814.1 ENTH/VHS family protein [Zea mays]